MSVYQEIPRTVSRKFFNYPAIVPERYAIGFMPRPDSGYDMKEIERWCIEQFGPRDDGWVRRSIYFFVTTECAFAFKMRWC